MRFVLAVVSAGVSLACDLAGYKAMDGLKAQVKSGVVEVEWTGERREQLRASFGIRDRQPVVEELAARKEGGSWIVLGKNLSPEFEVTTGIRRISTQRTAPLKEMNVALTPELVDREKWNAFWDAPLMIPGRAATNLGLPRKPEEVPSHGPSTTRRDVR